MEMTERRQRICEFIAKFTLQHGYAPTVRQIGDGAGISSTSVVQYHLVRLQRSGILKRDEGVSRSVCVSRKYLSILRRRTTRSGKSNGARPVAK